MDKRSKNKIAAYLASIGKKGGKARAAKHDPKTLSKWGRLGGRPKKSTETTPEGTKS